MLSETAWSLLPPAAVLLLGYSIRSHKYGVQFSMLFGIFLAAILSKFPSFSEGLKNALWHIQDNLEFSTFFSTTKFWESWNSFICIFLIILGILVNMMIHSGGAFAYVSLIKAKLRSKKAAESSSLILSSFFFIDDYFSSITVGSVMTPLTDKFRIPRVKLAFLVDAMAAPLAILCPFSSWVAAIIGFFRENGVSYPQTAATIVLMPPFSAYLNVLPYIVYSFLIMGSVWFIVLRGISFGKMGNFERIAHKTGNLDGGKDMHRKSKVRAMHERNEKSASMLDFLLPISFLFLSTVAGLLYSGKAAIFGGTLPLIKAMQNSSAGIGLFLGGISALILTTVYLLARNKLHFKEIPHIIWDGVRLIFPAIVILIFAWTLGDILRDDLRVGKYLAKVLTGNVPLPLLPALCYIVALFVAFATGSSWGSAAILFPIAVPLVVTLTAAPHPALPEHIPMLFPVLGAVLSGCVSGDHISPLSDTTLMSATSTGCPQFDHVDTQMTYSIPIIFSTFFAFLLIGLLANYGFFLRIVFPVLSSLLLCYLILTLLNRRFNKKN